MITVLNEIIAKELNGVAREDSGVTNILGVINNTKRVFYGAKDIPLYATFSFSDVFYKVYFKDGIIRYLVSDKEETATTKYVNTDKGFNIMLVPATDVLEKPVHLNYFKSNTYPGVVLSGSGIVIPTYLVVATLFNKDFYELYMNNTNLVVNHLLVENSEDSYCDNNNIHKIHTKPIKWAASNPYFLELTTSSRNIVLAKLLNKCDVGESLTLAVIETSQIEDIKEIISDNLFYSRDTVLAELKALYYDNKYEIDYANVEDIADKVKTGEIVGVL